MNSNPFGRDKYYAQSQQEIANAAKFPSALEQRIDGILREVAPDLKSQVERSFNRWNMVIREQLRNEMGLRLSVGKVQQSVPVRIVDGLPPPMKYLYENIPPEALHLLLNRASLEKSQQTLHALRGVSPKLAAWVGYDEDRAKQTSAGVQRTATFLDDLLTKLDKEKLGRRLLDFDQDVLGAYFFHDGHIHLYWMAIGIASGILGISAEALTMVVATHELSHAYSHIGLDIDGGAWDTEDFARCDIHIVEGIAQQYTEFICKRLEERFPAGLEAFQKLLTIQSTPYTDFRQWELPKDAAGEVVRISMISCRSKALVEYDEYKTLLMANGEVKRRRSKSPEDLIRATKAL